MAYLNGLYQPSIVELAQEGNCRALTHWINSFLGPQGIEVQVQPGTDRFLKILVNFRKLQQKDACLRLRDRLARFICYRLWTLNSDVIQGARIVALVPGGSKVLWQVSARINSPAAVKVRRAEAAMVRQLQSIHHLRFRIFRSLFMSSLTLVGFWMGYWLFSLKVGRLLTTDPTQTDPATEVPALTDDPEAATPIMMNREADSVPEASPQVPSLLGQANSPVPEEFRGEVVSQVQLPDATKVIALTFDDGPHPEITGQVLDILKQYNIKATFFMSGENVEQFPDVARRVVAEGHAVGNRGWHRGLGTGKDADPVREIDETTALIQKVTGTKTELFRPADGRFDGQLVSHAQLKDYAIPLWSVDSQDMLVAFPLVLDNVLRNVQPGRIVLLHDSPSKTIAPTMAAAAAVPSPTGSPVVNKSPVTNNSPGLIASTTAPAAPISPTDNSPVSTSPAGTSSVNNSPGMVASTVAPSIPVSATVQALPQLITVLQQQGYRFVTVPQLLSLDAANRQNGASNRQKDTKGPFRKEAVAAVQAKAEAVLSQFGQSIRQPG
jgi:chitin deacetylase